MNDDNKTRVPDNKTRVPDNIQSPQEAQGWSTWLLTDLGLKLVALGLALAFWGSVQLSTDVQDQLALRVHFIATTTTTSQAFFEWFWCLIFPFFLFKNFQFRKCARAAVSSLVSFLSTER